MCGIGGIIRTSPPGMPVPSHDERIPEAWLDVLDERIRHRGPDGQGRFRDRVVRPDGSTIDVALVHRRMSILDHEGGAQPMVSVLGGAGLHGAASTDFPRLALARADGALKYQNVDPGHGLLAVVFNGCVYNHRELRAQLQAKGHRFATDHSDTEVLLHAWREWNSYGLERLDAMCAAAIWDRDAGELVAWRDVAGEKPLYGIYVGDGFVFSSSVVGVESVARKLDPNRDATIREHAQKRIRELRASGAVAGATVTHADTHPTLGVPRKIINIGGLELAHWESMLNKPAGSRTRLKHWIPTGWSQTPVFSMAAEANPGWRWFCPPRPEPTGSYDGFLAPHFANEVIGNPEPLTADRTEALLRESVGRRLDADVPIGCFLSGGIDSGLIAAFARDHLRAHGRELMTFTMRMPDAALDESVAAAHTARHLGVRHVVLDCAADPATDLVHLIEQLGMPFGDSSLLPTYWLCKAAAAHVRVALAGDGGDELFAGYDRHIAADLIRTRGDWIRFIPIWIVRLLKSGRDAERARRLILACRRGGYDELLRIFDAEDWRVLSGMKPSKYREGGSGREYLRDAISYLPYDLLRKTDTASMAVPIEVRAPFLSFEMIRSAFRTPGEVTMPGGERKGLLKAVARRHLPTQIVDRPKMGFAIPIGEWFRTDYGGMRTLLLDHLNAPGALPPEVLGVTLDPRVIRWMIAEHTDRRRDHSQRLYMLLVVAIWCRWLARTS